MKTLKNILKELSAIYIVLTQIKSIMSERQGAPKKNIVRTNCEITGRLSNAAQHYNSDSETIRSELISVGYPIGKSDCQVPASAFVAIGKKYHKGDIYKPRGPRKK